MVRKPGDGYHGEFTVCNPQTGGAVAADSLPVASAAVNGVADAAFVLTVAAIEVGRYSITGAVPAYSAGDTVVISVTAAVDTVTGKGVVDRFTIDTALPGENATAIESLPVPPTAAQIRAEMDGNSTKLAYLNATISSRATVNDVWSAATRTITDKTGFSLSTAGILAIWNQATAAAGILANTFGGKLRDWVLGTDNKALISTDAQDLSGTLDVNAKTVEDKTGYTLTSAYDAAKSAATQMSVNAIPTTPLLANDARLDRIASIPTTPLLAEDYTAPDNASITAILTALQHATYGLAALDNQLDNITIAIGDSESVETGIQTLLTRLTNTRATLIDNLQHITEVPGLTAGQIDILTEARNEAKLARQLAGNKATISPDGQTVTIYADDDTTPLWTFNIPDAKTRIPA
jgi:hypothetical protein